MKTTQTKRGRPVGSKNKFKSNPFAKKWKGELTTSGGVGYVNVDMDNIVENAEQVKSWNRSPISQTVNLTYLFLGVIIGFSVCAIVVTPIIISLV